ncbi:unnamed protein product [Lactuca saligna]|uniref:Uncharacterized protein n=1 Tax=Lactuca saligna TaxID=75948 RepID=A0AA35Y8Q0_LACSI|nr:unnamed protein product [Lactuca saligna]
MGILLPRKEKKSRLSKKNEASTSEKPVTETKSKKSTKKYPSEVQVLVSKHKGKSQTPNVVRKPHVTHQGVIIREIPAPISPSSKKRRAEDMAKHISQKKKQTRKLVMTTESTENEDE